MQTIDLGATFAEATLEGVVLGVVYTSSQDKNFALTPSQGDRKGGIDGLGSYENGRGKRVFVEYKKESKKEEVRDDSRAKTLACLEDAVRKVGERSQMEGVLEFERGRVSFLVYRID